MKYNKHKRNAKGPTIGTAEINANKDVDFVAREKLSGKIWLFISCARKHVSEVRNYPANGLENAEVSVKLLQTREVSKDNRCFPVGVDPKHKDTIYNTSFWPTGIATSRFSFIRGSHFLSTTIKRDNSNNLIPNNTNPTNEKRSFFRNPIG